MNMQIYVKKFCKGSVFSRNFPLQPNFLFRIIHFRSFFTNKALHLSRADASVKNAIFFLNAPFCDNIYSSVLKITVQNSWAKLAFNKPQFSAKNG